MAEREDWQYTCIGCGKVTMASADFTGSCLGCGGTRWCCHWLGKDNSTKEPAVVKVEGQGITPPKELLPLKRNGNSTPGPKIPAIPDGLIKELASQGLGVKAIASRLADQGIEVSAMTIHRRLQASLL